MSAAEDRLERRRASWRGTRARARDGKVLLRIVGNLAELEDLLRANGLLPEIEPTKEDFERAASEYLRLACVALAACCSTD